MIKTRLLKTLIFSFLFLWSYAAQANSFITPSGEKIKLRLATTPEAQSRGLSGIKSHEFADNEGMLFMYNQSAPRRFWMPDTYFNLDIYFLDANFKILAVEKNVPHHPGRQEPPLIYQTKTYVSQHVLEMKSSSKISKKLKAGDKLRLKP